MGTGIIKVKSEIISKSNKTNLEDYLGSLLLEGYSEGTLGIYKLINTKMLEHIKKDVNDITTVDLRRFLNNYKETRNVSNVTLNNYQRYISAFFIWLYREDLIDENPATNLRAIKQPKILKDAYTQEEMEEIRDACASPRDRALIETLYSTGIRVSELISLNRDDINWSQKKARVIGKGNKERDVYFSTKAIHDLNLYLKDRKDDCPALFASEIGKAARMTTAGIRYALNRIGDRAGFKVHPHKFRHTCATVLLNRGMPIQEVATILGHAEVTTTMRYCTVNTTQVARDHEKFM